MRHAKISFIMIFLCLGFSAGNADAQRQITLTTYYPAPIGVYDLTRLVPRNVQPGACNNENRGMVYVNDARRLMYCDADEWIMLDVWTEDATEVYPTHFANDDVGIGTDEPDERLHVTAAALFEDSAAVNQNLGVSGRVGAGTQTPGYKLDVEGDMKVNKLYLNPGGQGVGEFKVLRGSDGNYYPTYAE